MDNVNSKVGITKIDAIIIERLKIKFFKLIEDLVNKRQEITFEEFLWCVEQTKDYFLRLTISTLNNDYVWDHFYFEYILNKRREYFDYDETTFKYSAKKKSRITSYTMDLVESSFKFLQIEIPFIDITKEMIEKNFKKLCFKYHPDHGGNDTDFIILQDSRDICLSFIEDLHTGGITLDNGN